MILIRKASHIIITATTLTYEIVNHFHKNRVIPPIFLQLLMRLSYHPIVSCFVEVLFCVVVGLNGGEILEALFDA